MNLGLKPGFMSAMDVALKGRYSTCFVAERTVQTLPTADSSTADAVSE